MKKRCDVKQIMKKQTPNMKPSKHKQIILATEEPPCNGQQRKKATWVGGWAGGGRGIRWRSKRAKKKILNIDNPLYTETRYNDKVAVKCLPVIRNELFCPSCILRMNGLICKHLTV